MFALTGMACVCAEGVNDTDVVQDFAVVPDGVVVCNYTPGEIHEKADISSLKNNYSSELNLNDSDNCGNLLPYAPICGPGPAIGPARGLTIEPAIEYGIGPAIGPAIDENQINVLDTTSNIAGTLNVEKTNDAIHVTLVLQDYNQTIMVNKDATLRCGDYVMTATSNEEGLVEFIIPVDAYYNIIKDSSEDLSFSSNDPNFFFSIPCKLEAYGI